MPVGSRYQAGADAPVQEHEVIVGQRRAAAGERGGGRVERRDPYHAVCRHDVVAGGVAGDRPAGAHVVVQQFQSRRGTVLGKPGDADLHPDGDLS